MAFGNWRAGTIGLTRASTILNAFRLMKNIAGGQWPLCQPAAVYDQGNAGNPRRHRAG